MRDLPGVNVYIDDVIVGSTENSPDELLANHERDLRVVMERPKEHDLHMSLKKAQLFVEEVEFCGHVMRDGQRRPSPGRIMAIQNKCSCKLPRTSPTPQLPFRLSGMHGWPLEGHGSSVSARACTPPGGHWFPKRRSCSSERRHSGLILPFLLSLIPLLRTIHP